MRAYLLRHLFFWGFLMTAVVSQAQSFEANYVPSTGRPDNLIVCGDSDNAIYRLELGPGSPQARDILVTVQLFEGVRAVAFDASNSSPGVSLVSLADPTRPVISVPDLVPTPTGRRAEFGLVLEARCGVLDSLNNHDDQGGTNPFTVFDRLSISYTALNGTTQTALEEIDPYLAAIAFPVFSLTDTILNSPFRVGDQITRTNTIANGSFRGYADTVIYEVQQGLDATITAIRVNGVDRPFTKTPVGNDTLITLVLAGNDFVPNLNGVNPGNGDTRFDPEENMTIEEDLVILSCGPDRLSTHRVQFGCDGQFCSETVNQSEIFIGSGQPELSVERATPFPTEDVGYCKPGELQVWIQNVGRETDPTFGEAHNLSISAVFSDFGAALAANGYVITQLDIAGVPVSSVQLNNRLDSLPAFQVDPDGVGGLDDLDGDGVFDDLALADSFPLTIFYELDCSALDADLIDDNCANDAFTTFQVFAYFDNACGNRLNGQNIGVYTPQNVQDDFEQRTQPDAFAEGAPFQIELEFGRLVFRFDESACSGTATMRTYIDLPSGITIDAGSSALSRGGGAAMPLLGVTQTGTVAMLEFDPSAEPNLNGVYTLVVGLSADCTAALGETNFNTRLAYFCPDCSCEHTWICEDIIGPWIHKTDPPCPAGSLFPCPQGVQGNSFTINRTTIGWDDPTFTTPFNPDSVRTKVAIPADSVEIVMNGLVGDNTVTDSLGVILHYFTPNDRIDTAGLFLLGSGTLEWKDGATWRTCAVPAIAHTLESDTTETWQRFDLSQCLLTNGWAINPDDSIRFTGHFEINPLGPILDSYEFVEDLRGGFYAVDAGTETQCDQFGDTFRVGAPLTAFGIPTNGTFPRGCDSTALEFRLTGINRGYLDEFGPEYRRSARLDSLVIQFDTAILSAFDNISTELYVAGHPTQGNTFYPVRPLSDFPDGRYVLLLDTLNHSSDLVTNQSFLYNFRINLSPNCGSIRSSSDNDQFYDMQATPFYRDRYYAIDIGSGSRVENVSEAFPFTMSYEDPAILDLDILTPAYQRITTDSAFITMEICNTSTRSDAGRSWLTFDDTTSLSIVEALLIDDINNPVSLPIDSFSGGHYVNMEGLARVNGINTSQQVCNLVQLKVRTDGCELNGIRFATGWGCESTVPVGWNPAVDAACIDDVGLSEFEPIAPFLEADLIREPSAAIFLCTDFILEYQVNNAQPGTAYDVLSKFIVPEGMEYVPGSIEVEYPAEDGVDNFQPTVSDLVPLDTTVRGFGWGLPDLDAVHPFLGANGLQGFDVTSPTDSNRFVLRMTFTTNCEFRAGSIVYFEAEGFEACGDQTNLAAAESSAIQIAGATPDGTHGYSVGLDPDSRISLTDPVSTLEVFAENTGSNPTDADDVLQVTLPAGFTYEPGTSLGLEPGGYVPGEPLIDTMGSITLLEWPLPIGMAPGATARLAFGVRPAAASCGDLAQAELAAIRYETTICVSGGTNCRIPTDITQGGAQLVDLPIGQVFSPTVIENSATCATATTENVTLEVLLTAAGFTLSGTPVEVALYYDSNGDQIAGPGDMLLDQVAVPTVNGATATTYTFSGELDRTVLNNLLLRVDSVGVALCAPQMIPLGLPALDNAGAQDLYNICINDNNTLTLGDPACAGATDVVYLWSTEPSGFTSYLSDVLAAAPVLTVPDPHVGPDTIDFILTSSRIGLGNTRDTVTIVIGSGVELGQGPTNIIDYGDQIVLTPNILSGTPPFTYQWSPANSLSDPADAQPIASPVMDQLYTLVLTDQFGCTNSTTHLVRVRNPINPTASTQDTTICPEDRLTITVAGATDIQWIEGPANPAQGGLDTLAGATVEFSAQGGIGEYLYDVRFTDPAFPGYDSTIQIRINVDPNAGCLVQCDLPTLISEVTTNSDCTRPTGSIVLTYTTDISDFQTAWTNEAGDTLAQNTTQLTTLPVGIYTFSAVNTTDTVCQFEQTVYVSGNGAPTASVSVSDADCGAANGSATLTPAILSYLWDDGSTANSRNDLASGLYRVAVSDPAEPLCTRYVVVAVGEGPGLTVTASINTLPSCGSSNGAVTLNVVGGTGDYDFSWSVNSATNNNLSAGAYTVLVFDRNTGCAGLVSFVLQNNVPSAVVNIMGTSPEACTGDATGSIDFMVGYDGAFSAPADTFIVSALGDTLSNGNLTAGEYCVFIVDANGCVAGGACTTIEQPSPLRLDFETEAACGVNNGALTVTVREATLPIQLSFSDGSISDSLVTGNFAPGDYTVTLTDARGCSTEGSFTIEQCPPCGYTSAGGDTTLVQTSCDGTAAICISGIADRANDIVIYANDSIYTGPLVPCDYGRTRLTYLIGLIDFSVPVNVSLMIDGSEFTASVSSLNELIAFFTSNDPAGNWSYDAATLAIIGGQTNGVYSDLQTQRQGSSITNNIPYNERIEPFGLAIELTPGFYDIVVLDTVAPCADTLFATVHCAPIDTLVVNVPVTTTEVFCVSTNDLLGDLVSMTNYCVDTTYATYTQLNDTCVTVFGNAVGTQTGCWVVCDDLGICDTTIVIVNVLPDSANLIWRDTILVDESGQLCLTPADVGLQPGNMTVFNSCPQASGDFVDFFVDDQNNCIDYDGLFEGVESACLTFCDAQGNCVTGTLIVTVLPETKVIVERTIFINQTDSVCLDTVSQVTNYQFFRTTDSLVEASINQDAGCAVFRGLQLGQDTLGFEAVRQDGSVFQACIVITVVPYDGLPEAVSDSTCTERNTPIRVNVLANDQVFGGVASFTIIEQPHPEDGVVFVNPDNTITFEPAADICARDVSFVYEVCNPNTPGCDTATVTICIECDELIIFTALSPNGDGINDVFFISQIEDFPNNSLRIYNRWGTLVHAEEGYLNTWRGTYNGDPLPDGAYFFVLDVVNAEQTQTYNGYIEILR